MQDRMFDEWAGPLVARGDAKPLVAQMAKWASSQRAMDAVIASSVAMDAVVDSSVAMDAVAASSVAMDAVAASATAMDAVIASSVAMDAVVDSSVAMDAVAASATAMDKVVASSTAMNAIFASLTGRTLIFTTAYPDKLWGSSTAITSFATYLNGLTRSLGTGAMAVKITMPIDGSLVSAVSSIYSRSTSTNNDYDTRIMKASPSENSIMNATDVTAWTEYSGTIASDDTGIIFDVEVAYSTYVTFVVSRVNEATYNNVISMSYNGTTNPHYFYKMRFTRRT